MSEDNLPAEKSPLQQAAEGWWTGLPEAERTYWMDSAEALWGPGRATTEDAYLRFCAVSSIRAVIEKVRRGE
jgi:hypothetical protein